MTASSLLLVLLLGANDVPQKLDAFLQPYVATNNFSGAVLIARDGAVIAKKSYGLANQEYAVPNTIATKFQLASLSKVFTATAILVLEQQGRLSVDDPVAKYLPDYPRGGEITIHHLLCHRSGIPNVNQLPGWEDNARAPQTPAALVALFHDQPLAFTPGSKAQYSNSNYMLLGLLVEKVSGVPFGEFLQKNVFAPAGMKDTGHRGSEAEIVRGRATGYQPAGVDALEHTRYIDWSSNTGAASIYSTAEDLYRFDRALRAGKVLTPASQAKMFHDHGDEYGYGWFMDEHRFGRRVASVAGRSPGFNSYFERALDEDIAIIALSNNYSSIGQTVGAQILPLVLGEKVTDPLAGYTRARGTVPPALLGEYQFGPDFGYNPNLKVRIEQVPAGVIMRSSAGDSFLIPIGELRFIDRLYGGTVRFAAAPTPALTWSFGRDFTARKLP
jgi:CubicO group peptidase (beta-lactamase class C family)